VSFPSGSKVTGITIYDSEGDDYGATATPSSGSTYVLSFNFPDDVGGASIYVETTEEKLYAEKWEFKPGPAPNTTYPSSSGVGYNATQTTTCTSSVSSEIHHGTTTITSMISGVTHITTTCSDEIASPISESYYTSTPAVYITIVTVISDVTITTTLCPEDTSSQSSQSTSNSASGYLEHVESSVAPSDYSTQEYAAPSASSTNSEQGSSGGIQQTPAAPQSDLEFTLDLTSTTPVPPSAETPSYTPALSPSSSSGPGIGDLIFSGLGGGGGNGGNSAESTPSITGNVTAVGNSTATASIEIQSVNAGGSITVRWSLGALCAVLIVFCLG
jgi:hypothetical protein